MYMALFWHGPHVLIEGDKDYDCYGYFLRAHMGVVFWGLEIFAGWDGWLIGDVAIGGLSGGLRIWL